MAFQWKQPVNDDNRPDSGFVDGVNVWCAGELALTAKLRQLVPGVLILDDGTLVTGPEANGREFENGMPVRAVRLLPHPGLILLNAPQA